MEPPEADEGVAYRWYVVAVLDILGQKKAIRCLDKLPPGSADALAMFRALENSAGDCEEIRCAIQSAFDKPPCKVDVTWTQELNDE